MVNLCRPGLLSRCAACAWSEQQACPFAQKAPRRGECLHYTAATDGRCGSADAIAAARREGADDERAP